MVEYLKNIAVGTLVIGVPLSVFVLIGWLFGPLFLLIALLGPALLVFLYVVGDLTLEYFDDREHQRWIREEIRKRVHED